MKGEYGTKGFTDPIIEKLSKYPSRFNTGTFGMKKYEDVPANAVVTITPLISRANLEMRQNESPTMRSVVNFAAKCPTAKFDGYIITKEREDERVTFDAVSIPPKCESIANRSLLRSAREKPDFDERNYRGNYRHVWWD